MKIREIVITLEPSGKFDIKPNGCNDLEAWAMIKMAELLWTRKFIPDALIAPAKLVAVSREQ